MNKCTQNIKLNFNCVRMEQFARFTFILPLVEEVVKASQQINSQVVDGYIGHTAFLAEGKVLNEQLRLMLVQANETYQELASDGDVSSAKVIKNLDAEYVSPSFMAFARERAQMIYDNGGWRNWRKYCGLINKLDAFRKKRRMADITVDDLTVDLLTRFGTSIRRNCSLRTFASGTFARIQLFPLH